MSLYIKVPAILDKFKKAEEENKILFISGPSGYGKSAAFRYYYRRKPYLELNGRTGTLNQMPKPSSIRQGVILFEDICFLKDEASKKYVLDVLYYGQRNIVLTGRGKHLPGWLVKADLDLEFVRAGRQDLIFSPKETFEYLEKTGHVVTMDEAKLLTEKLNGYPVFIILHAKNMNEQVDFSREVYEIARRELYYYLDENIWKLWSEDLTKVVLAGCEFEYFTVPLIEKITEVKGVSSIIERSFEIGSFIKNYSENTFCIDGEISDYIKWRRSLVYTKEDYVKLYIRAAEYYESVGDVEFALKYYDKSGKYDKVSEILIRNTNYGPAKAQLFKCKKYLFSIPEEDIKKSPELMGAVSLLYSIMMRPQESEEWYRLLEEYMTRYLPSQKEYTLAKVRLAYLDIYLMHRSAEERLLGLKKAAKMIKEEHIEFPELVFTGNTPSLLNGAIDLSKWMKENNWRVTAFIKPIRDIFGTFGNGVILIAFTEAMLEQNAVDSYELMTRLNRGYALADAAGRIEVCFVATVLMARQRLTRGRIGAAMELIRSFKEKAMSEEAKYLLPNIEAFMAWIALLQGNISNASEWLKKAPDENKEFYIINRYQYIQKIRVCIALEKMEQACSLMQRLKVYFTDYGREYFGIQNQLLFAIALYRTGDVRWERIFLGTLEKAEEYNYVRVIADEGAAILPMLNKIKKQLPKNAFFKDITDEVEKMAKIYPDYLNVVNKLEEPLTKKEIEILKLMICGKETEEICRICDISYSGLKFHNRNIYRKLKVKNRQEAERKAQLLRIGD